MERVAPAGRRAWSAAPQLSRRQPSGPGPAPAVPAALMEDGAMEAIFKASPTGNQAYCLPRDNMIATWEAWQRLHVSSSLRAVDFPRRHPHVHVCMLVRTGEPALGPSAPATGCAADPIIVPERRGEVFEAASGGSAVLGGGPIRHAIRR